MQTSKEAWEDASRRHQEARQQVQRLRDALAAADDALEFAEWYLRRHELSPGIPLYSHVDDPPEADPGEAEAQRIAEVFADARAELDRGL